MRIVVDVAGGDLGLKPNVEGAVRAMKEFGYAVTLVGPKEAICQALDALGVRANDTTLTILDTPVLIEMGEEPVTACREKPTASIMLAAEQAAKHHADALVSAGHSGATMVAALWHLKRINGVLRPAIACPVPTLKGRSVLLDAGANTDCKPWHLLQFGLMGSIYARHILKISHPSVGLLSIGEEENKGNELVRETLPLLKFSGLNFFGPVEGRDIPKGTTDVVVCDGFVGNVCLKLLEGTASSTFQMLKTEIASGLVSRVGGLLIKNAAHALKKKIDYEEHGGAPLLGVDGTVIICHGKSSAKAIFNAIRVSGELVTGGAKEQIRSSLEEIKSKMEFARVTE